MNDQTANNANNRNNIPVIPEFARQNPTVVIVLKIVVVSLFILPLIHHSLFQHNNNDQTDLNNPNDNNDDNLKTQVPDEEIVKKLPPRRKIPQPSCPPENPNEIVLNLCEELYEKWMTCSPEDVNNVEKHKVPNQLRNSTSTGEPRGTIVGCVAAGLLLTSLGAAFVELYKAKSQASTAKTKPPMSRKCSLADLTVLKHNRKELVRRESILELPETGGPMKQMGWMRIPPPLNRRCSFPVGPIEYGTYPETRRTSMEYRRLSIIDSRRNSSDFMNESRRISLDESPERRHWSRLVHRH